MVGRLTDGGCGRWRWCVSHGATGGAEKGAPKFTKKGAAAPKKAAKATFSTVTNGTAWTASELAALKKGVGKHGVGNWAEIAKDSALSGRTNVNLKDK